MWKNAVEWAGKAETVGGMVGGEGGGGGGGSGK